MVSKKAEKQPYTALFARLNNSHPFVENNTQRPAISAGKRRTKKRNVIKRRTRKHKKI